MAKPRRSIKRRLTNRFQQKRIPQFGLLGDYSHTVEVPGRPNYVYVRFAGQDVVSEVFNDRVAPLEDLEVLVGYDPEEPNVYQVLDIRSNLRRYAEEDETIAYLPEHHRTHEWMNMPGGGNDVVFVELRQFMPLRVTPTTTGVALSINRGVIYGEDRWIYVTGQTVNFGSYLPGTGSRYALLSVGLDDGLPDIQIGTLKDTATLLFDDIPDPIPGTYPLAAVRLYGEQTRIYEAYSNTDIADLRFPGVRYTTGSAGGGASTFLDLTDTPSSYAGYGGYAVFVNQDEDGLYFELATGTSGESNPIIIYDDTVFKTTGTAISFDDNLSVSVTGSIAYISSTPGTGSVSDFLDLTDTPSSYSGQANKFVAVNTGETGLEFVTGTGNTFDYAEDTSSIPPTDGELDTIFGQPSALGDGFLGVLDNGGFGTNIYGVIAANNRWHYWEIFRASISTGTAFTSLLLDLFTDTPGVGLDAHTMDVGGGWTEHNGTWVINNNTVRQTTTSGTGVVFVSTADAGDSDFLARVRVKTSGSSTSYQGGLIFRFTDVNNHWLLFFDAQTSTPTVGIQEVVTGSYNIRAQKSWTKQNNTYIDLELKCDGDVISAWVDGGYSLIYTGSFNNTATRIGVWEYQDSNYKSNIFEDFQVVGLKTYDWYKVGTILTGSVAWEEDSIYEPSTIYENGLYKIWYSGGGWTGSSALGYAYSLDGINFTKHPSNPVISNVWRGIVQKYGSTYYYYGVQAPNATQVNLYTANDGTGTSWSLDTSGVLSLGSGGAWDDYEFGNVFVWLEGSNDWYMIYEAKGDVNETWKLGYATSSDGRTWTKYPSNPVISPDGSIGGAFVKKDGNYYYLYAQRSPEGKQLPSYIYRYRSADLINWEQYPQISIIKRDSSLEGENTYVGQVADPHIIEADGQSWMFIDATADGSAKSGNFHLVLFTGSSSAIAGW